MPVKRKRLLEGPTRRECGAFEELKIVQGGCRKVGDEPEEFGQAPPGLESDHVFPWHNNQNTSELKQTPSHLPPLGVGEAASSSHRCGGLVRPMCFLSAWDLPWSLHLPLPTSLSAQDPQTLTAYKLCPVGPWVSPDHRGPSRDCELLKCLAGSALGECGCLLCQERCPVLNSFWQWAEP